MMFSFPLEVVKPSGFLSWSGLTQAVTILKRRRLVVEQRKFGKQRVLRRIGAVEENDELLRRLKKVEED